MTPDQEEQYIRLAQKQPKAFVHLYDHYFPRMHAYVCYRVSNRRDAEDLIADVFFRAIRQLGRYRWRGPGSFAAWLFRIAHNRIVDYYRQMGRVDVSSSDCLSELPNHAATPEEVMTQQVVYDTVRALVLTLSPRRREVITLKFFGGLRNFEIADILGLDERTVASHLSRGLRDLEQRYNEHRQLDVLMEVPE